MTCRKESATLKCGAFYLLYIIPVDGMDICNRLVIRMFPL